MTLSRMNWKKDSKARHTPALLCPWGLYWKGISLMSISKKVSSKATTCNKIDFDHVTREYFDAVRRASGH
jgi:hypothetical protein